MRHLSGDPKANVVILGDFNEGHPVGSDGQALSVLFQAKPPMLDALSTLSGEISPHTNGKAYDRILVSEAIARGLNRLKLERVVIQGHPVDAPVSLAERTDWPLRNLKLG